MTDDDIRALRTALADGPTPGPWESLPVGHGPHYVARVNNREVVPPDACELAHEIVDARYIAAASPDRIARLLDEVERLRAFERGVIEAIPGPRYMDPPDGGDVTPLEQVRRMATEVEQLRGALTAANAQAEHFEREWYLRGDEVERLRAENMTLRNQRDELHIILDKRPAMNEGLREAYAKWSAGVYALDWMDAADIDAACKEEWK